MKLKEDFELCEIAGNTFLIPIGAAVIDMHKMLDLNETSLFIINILKERECSVKELADEMIKEYEVSEELVEKDIEEFMQKGIDLGFLEA